MQTVEIKQLVVYAPIAHGGQKLAALDANGVVLMFDDIKQEWFATNISPKRLEKAVKMQSKTPKVDL